MPDMGISKPALLLYLPGSLCGYDAKVSPEEARDFQAPNQYFLALVNTPRVWCGTIGSFGCIVLKQSSQVLQDSQSRRDSCKSPGMTQETEYLAPNTVPEHLGDCPYFEKSTDDTSCTTFLYFYPLSAAER